MTTASLDILRTKIAAFQTCRPLGRVRQIGDGRLLITGLNQSASLGEEVICRAHHGALRAEITSLSPEGVEAMPYGCADGLRLNAEVEIAGPPTIAPDDTWIGRIIDPFGLPLDGRPLRSGQSRPIRGVPPSAGMRHGFGERLATGYATMDTLLPIAEGQRIGIFAGSGVGKSRLLGDLAREMDADIVVAALIGERGREVASFARDTMGPAGMARATVIAATSDRPANVRRRALPAALAVAERFREQGARVLFVCDSLTRHAEAYRDVMGGGKDSDLPPGLVADLAACVERAGPGSGRDRAITAVFSVLVAGSDMEEPVADAVRGLLDGHIVLSREIAEAGRFPAIDPLASVSRSLPDVATKSENEIISRTRRILETFSRNELMITSGLYEQGRDPEIDEAIRKRTSIEAVFTQTTADPSESFSLLQSALQ